MRGKCLKVEKEGELVEKKKKWGRLERGFGQCREKRERGSDEKEDGERQMRGKRLI